MTATINASAGGVVLTSDTSGSLALQSGGVTQMTVGASGPSLTSPTIVTGLTWPDGLLQSRIGWQKYAADTVVSGSSVATIDITGIPSGVKALRLLFRLTPVTNAQYIIGQVSVAGVFKTAATYGVVLRSGASNAGGSNAGSATATGLVLSDSTYTVSSSATYNGCSGTVEFPDLQNAAYPQAYYQSVWGPDSVAGVYWAAYGAGSWLGVGPVDGFRFFYSSGNIAIGSRVSVLALYG